MPQQSDAMPAAGAAPSKPWFYFLLGASTLASLGLLTAILFIQFLQHRPTDLRPHTAYYSQSILAVLNDSQLAAASVRQAPPESQSDGRTMWDFFRFDVDVPPQLSPDGLRDLCAEALAALGLNVTEPPDEGSVRKLAVAYGQYEFARIAFLPAAPAPGKLNLRAAAYETARLVDNALQAAGLARDAITRTPAEEMENEQALWALTRFSVILAPPMTPESLQPHIASALTGRNAQIVPSNTPHGTTSAFMFNVALEDKTCVEITAILPGQGSTDPTAQTPAAGPETAPSEQLPPLDELPLESTDHQNAENGQPAIGPLPPEQRPRIAVILDDGGYGAPETEPALSLDTGVTLSILPNTPHAGAIATLGREKGFEIMLHMPMETARKNGKKTFPGEIGVAMNEQEIEQHALDALAQIPGAVGVNNHTGGVFTADAEKMKIFLGVVKDQNLFFVDSRTTPASKAFETARGMGIPAAHRTVFLDNDKDPEKIRRQFDELLEKAKTKGQAIGIGHFRPNTIAVLAGELPKLEAGGVDLVHVSELLQ